jgi:hypothetical protein
MKFKVSWSIPQSNWLPLCKQFGSMSPQERADAGAGVTIIGRWHDVSARTGVAIVESNDLAAVQRYSGRWNAFMDLDIAPVLDDEETAVVARQIVADNNA